MTELPKSIVEAVKKIDSRLECPLCLEAFKEPKLLPCFHIFCKSPCLEELATQDPEGKTLTCPSCQHHVTLPDNGVAGLQQDFHTERLFEIRELLEKAVNTERHCENCETSSDKPIATSDKSIATSDKPTATSYCQECPTFMCTDCTMTHKRWGSLKNHKVLSMEEMRADPSSLAPPAQCEVHQQKSDIYCDTCSALICYYCVIGIHKEHTHVVVKDTLPLVRDELEQSARLLKTRREEIQTALKAFDTTKDEIINQKAIFKENIDKKFNELMELLKQQKTKLLENLEYHTSHKVHDLATQRESVEYTYAKIQSCLEYVESGLRDGREVDILRMKGPVLERISQITADYNPDAIQPHEKANLELLIDINQLQQTCQKFDDIVAEQMVYVKNCYAAGDGAKFAIAGQQTSLEVHTHTRENKACTHRLNLTAELVNDKTRDTLECEIWYRQRGQCKVSYRPRQRGKHSLHLKIDGRHIQGSPYPIAVAPSLASLNRPIRMATNMSRPHRAITNSQGQLIVGDFKECEVIVMTSEGNVEFKIGEQGSEIKQFKQPCGVAVDKQDNLYVADNDNNRIQKYSYDGSFIDVLGSQGSGDLEFYFPLGIEFNRRDQCLYVCDQRNHRIQVITTYFKFVRCFGERGDGNGQLQNPKYAAFDDSNNLYVTDYTNNRVQVFTAEGQFVRTFSKKGGEASLLEPYGIAIDSGNIVYVSELSQNCVNMFTTEGDFITSFGTMGTEEGQFNRIRGLNICNDSLLVSEAGNSRLQIFDLNSTQ